MSDAQHNIVAFPTEPSLADRVAALEIEIDGNEMLEHQLIAMVLALVARLDASTATVAELTVRVAALEASKRAVL